MCPCHQGASLFPQSISNWDALAAVQGKSAGQEMHANHQLHMHGMRVAADLLGSPASRDDGSESDEGELNGFEDVLVCSNCLKYPLRKYP